MSGVFDGVRVIDLSSGIAGPMTTMMLADGGADVVRIERPGGDQFADQTGYRVWNRGKRNALLDLTDPTSLAALHALVKDADVIVQAGAPGTAERLGVDHATLGALNSRLITCAISGYGDHPDHRDRPGYDALVAARTGLLFDQKGRRGTPMNFIADRPAPFPEFDLPEGLVRGAARSGPVFPRTSWPSIGATYLATLGIAAALRARETTGRGQLVETSLLRGALAAVCLNWQRVEHPDAALYWMWPVDSRSIEGLYECSDGRWVHHWTVRPNWVFACASGDELTPPDLTGAYRDDPDRVSMEEDGLLAGMFMHDDLAAAFKKFPASEWIKAADEAGMGVALVRSPSEALADEALMADGCVVEIDDPEVGRIRHCGPLLEFSKTPSSARRPAALRGEHTAAVLAQAASAGARSGNTSSRSLGSLAHPLAGVRVIDLGLGVAGPFAGRMMADLGADVIKVHAMHDSYWAGTHMGLGTNRGKRSIALNLKHPSGRAVLDRLIEGADVVTTNWRPGAASRLGIDYPTLSERFPRLVYCNSRGYEKGARARLPGTDQTAAALSGTEWEDGGCDAGNPPLWSRSNMGDTGNALLSAIAITSALYHRDRTGEGQEVSTSIVNAGLLHTSYAWIDSDGKAADWGHVDRDQFGLAPTYRMFECADDTWIFIAALDDPTRERLFTALGLQLAAADDSTEFASAVEAAFLARSAIEWSSAMDSASVPAEVIDELFCRKIFEDPAARESGLIAQTWCGHVGTFEDAGLLITFSETPGTIQRGPSLCGQHSREILRELGFSETEIDGFVAERAVLDAPVTGEAAAD
jgi:crotonobetainyl-CoA:carnitine CoA-transferase CaiB-like acyl-CoA transferase